MGQYSKSQKGGAIVRCCEHCLKAQGVQLRKLVAVGNCYFEQLVLSCALIKFSLCLLTKLQRWS